MSIFDKIFNRKKNENVNIANNNQNIADYNQKIQDQIKDIVTSLSNISKSIKNLELSINEQREKVEKISEYVDRHEKDISELKDTFEKVLGLYDVISRQYNPFIEEENLKIENEVKENEIVNEEKDALPLEDIPSNPAIITIVLGWIGYLVKKSNLEEARKAIEYYESIGWIGEKAKIKLLSYLDGINSISSLNQKLNVNDHIVSLYIITKIKTGLKENNIYRIKDLYKELINKGIIKPGEI